MKKKKKYRRNADWYRQRMKFIYDNAILFYDYDKACDAFPHSALDHKLAIKIDTKARKELKYSDKYYKASLVPHLFELYWWHVRKHME